MDSIYPAVPEDGLVKNKMETLVYYALTSPEKLDRIGEYLAQRYILYITPVFIARQLVSFLSICQFS